MGDPGVGPASELQHGETCAYSGPSPDVEEPCDKPPTMHLLVRSKLYGMVALQSCNEHLWIARTAGQVVQQHKFTAGCCFPGTKWSRKYNACALDVSGMELSSE